MTNSAVQVAHARVPGRVRLKIASLYRSGKTGEFLHAALADVDGIEDVKVNVLTASVLVVYSDPLDIGAIVETIAGVLGLEPQTLTGAVTPPGASAGATATLTDTATQIQQGLAQIIDLSHWRRLLRGPRRPGSANSLGLRSPLN